MSEGNGAGPRLVYEGEPIRRRDEKLSLTDMWRAAGADPTKQPARWARMPPTQEFAAHLAANGTIPPISGFETQRGNGGGTWAHWQLGLAYAKYLSPAFHAWCNEVVRAVMEGEPVPPPARPEPGERPLTAADLIAAFDAFGRGFRGETAAVVAAAVAPIDARLGQVEAGLGATRAEIASIRVDVAGGLALLREAAGAKRRGFSKATREDLLRAAHEAGGMCPCCKRARVTNPDGTKAPHTELHHIAGRWDNTIRNGAPLCRTCHLAFSADPAAMRAEYAAELEAFHRFRERLPGAQGSLSL